MIFGADTTPPCYCRVADQAFATHALIADAYAESAWGEPSAQVAPQISRIASTAYRDARRAEASRGQHVSEMGVSGLIGQPGLGFPEAVFS